MRFRSSLLVVLIFAASQANAEGAMVSLRAAESLTKADEDARQICAQIKKDPTCGSALSLMKSAMALSVDSCQAQLASRNCTRFVEQFPEYKDKLMRCEPYEVCKLSLGSAMAEGCKRYGIEVKNQFVQTLTSLGACSTQIRCIGKNLYYGLKEAISALVIPGVLAKKVSDAEVHLIENIHGDYQKMQDIACLDPQNAVSIFLLPNG